MRALTRATTRRRPSSCRATKGALATSLVSLVRMQRAWIFASYAALSLGCANSQTVNQCAPESWAGECQLASVTKVEDAEFPIPHVVMEAVYRPVQNASYPGYTPGALAQRTLAKSQHELALYDFLEAHPRVSCNTEAPRGGACVAPTVAVGMPPF